jgi:hypothetical protein
MTPRIVILLCGICVFVFSCRSDKIKKEAETKTGEFFLMLKNEDEKGLARLYAGFSKFVQYYKSDSGSKHTTWGMFDSMITAPIFVSEERG